MNDTLYFIYLIGLTFLIAGFVKGVTGMGLPTVAMGVLGSFMSPVMAATILLIPSLVTNVWQMFSGSSMNQLIKRFWLMMLFIILGTVMGAIFLHKIPTRWASLSLGLALIIYAAYTLIAPKVTIIPSLEKKLSPLIGFITGIITGLTGVFVMPAVPYLSSLNMTSEELVQALGLSFTVSTIALALGLGSQHVFSLQQINLSMLAVIPALLGMKVGQYVRQHISAQRFRQFFLIFLMLLGLQLLLKSLS